MISQDAMDTHIPGDLIGISLLVNILGKETLPTSSSDTVAAEALCECSEWLIVQRHGQICRKCWKRQGCLGVWAGASVEYSSRYKIARRAPTAAAQVPHILKPRGGFGSSWGHSVEDGKMSTGHSLHDKIYLSAMMLPSLPSQKLLLKKSSFQNISWSS